MWPGVEQIVTLSKQLFFILVGREGVKVVMLKLYCVSVYLVANTYNRMGTIWKESNYGDMASSFTGV